MASTPDASATNNLPRCATCTRGESTLMSRPSLYPLPNQDDDSPFRILDAAPDKLALATADEEGKPFEYKWDDQSTIYIKFMYSDPKTHNQNHEKYHKAIEKMVKEVAPLWMPWINVEFKFVSLEQKDILAQIHLFFWTSEEAKAAGDPEADGHWSLLGQSSRGHVPSMNLEFVPILQQLDDPKCSESAKDYYPKYMRATILHEFGHALGFVHEHLRSDRTFNLNMTKIIEYYKEEEHGGWSEEQTIEQVNKLYPMTSLKASAFDIKSIMIYNFPEKLIASTGKEKEVKETFELSDVDKVWASTIYPPDKKNA